MPIGEIGQGRRFSRSYADLPAQSLALVLAVHIWSVRSWIHSRQTLLTYFDSHFSLRGRRDIAGVPTAEPPGGSGSNLAATGGPMKRLGLAGRPAPPDCCPGVASGAPRPRWCLRFGAPPGRVDTFDLPASGCSGNASPKRLRRAFWRATGQQLSRFSDVTVPGRGFGRPSLSTATKPSRDWGSSLPGPLDVAFVRWRAASCSRPFVFARVPGEHRGEAFALGR